ncbi:MAG: hypothetical protein JW938_03945 [Candidatus Omnitrophica bacterium]|nr:hypothetical protein [Candidatus Omnitrophota bacterium]
MDKKKVEILVAVGLVVIFLVIILQPKKKNQQKKVSYEVQEITGVESVLSSINLIKGNKINVAALEALDIPQEEQTNGRNPFDILVQTNPIAVVPVVEESSEEDSGPFPDLKIQGVVFAQDNPQDSVAIIDDKELKIGDTIEGWTIIIVRDEMVTFQKGKTVHKVNLYEQDNMN